MEMHTRVDPKPAGVEQAAMLVATWGDLAGVAARLIRIRPGIAARLALAPTRAIHATAAYLHHVVASNYEDEVVGHAVERIKPRDLLRETLPAAHPRLYRLLDRAGPQAKPHDFYERLDAGLHGSASAVLLRAQNLGPDTLDTAELIAADPVLLAVKGGLDMGVYGMQCLGAALAYVRALGLAADVETLPRGAGVPALMRRIEADLGRGRPPPAPFPVPAGWRQVATIAELWALGRELHNCIGRMRGAGVEHASAYLASGEVILVSLAEPVVLASTASVGPGLWHVAQCAGRRNVAPPPEMRAGLEQAFRDSGVHLVHLDCVETIQHVAFRIEGSARRRRDRVLDDALA